MRYMLDTNICIHLIHRQPEHVLRRFAQLAKGDVVISVVTLAELRHGVETRPEAREAAERGLALFLDLVPALDFDADAAVHYGRITAAMRERKRDALDRMIAAHALSTGLVLVTNNETDFKNVPGLAIENWVKEPSCN
jgi:tRNA(fMet)-specific endonuclease VapC